MKNNAILITILLLSAISLIGCDKNNEKDKPSSSKEKVTTVSSEDSLQKNIDIALDSLKKGGASNMNVSFDKKSKSFNLSPIEGLSVTDTLKAVADNPTNQKHEETLKNMASNFIEVSTTISKKIGKDYKLKLKYPGDDKRDIFIIQDGNVSYPIITKYQKNNQKTERKSNPPISTTTVSENEKNVDNQAEHPTENQDAVEVENAKVEEEIKAIQKAEEDRLNAENAKLAAEASSENARIRSEEEADKTRIQAAFEEDQRKADEFNSKLQAEWEAENARLTEQDKANGY